MDNSYKFIDVLMNNSCVSGLFKKMGEPPPLWLFYKKLKYMYINLKVCA